MSRRLFAGIHELLMENNDNVFFNLFLHVTANIDYDSGLTDIFVGNYAEKIFVNEVDQFFKFITMYVRYQNI